MGRRIEQQAVNRERMDRRGRRRLEERGQARNTGAAKHNREQIYVYDSLAREYEAERVYEEAWESAPVREIEDRRKRADIAFILPAMLMVCAVAAVFILYIFLTAELTTQTRKVAALKVEVNDLHDKNIEERNRIENSVDPMTMKYICMSQLGMGYPEEGQVITYDNSGFDYMRQVMYND